ncbi:MAG: hypothetical protein L0Y64_16325 [Myxococcaceae bacterium]|nr:hypothetical protein [Myxococcaceae bacterium]
MPLTTPGVEESFRALLGLTVVLPARLRTAGVLVGVVLTSGLLLRTAHHGPLAWGMVLVPAAFVLAGLTALLLQASAQGLDRLGPEEDDVRPSVLGPALRLLPVTTFLLALPQLSEHAPVWREGPALDDVFLFVAGGLLGPALSLGLVLGRPVHTARRLLSLGPDAWLTAVLTGLTLLLAWHFLAAAAFIERQDAVLGFFTAVLHAAAILGLLWLARLHGTLLHAHATAFGYPLSPRHQVPVTPGARPRGTPWRPPAPPPKVVVPLEL